MLVEKLPQTASLLGLQYAMHPVMRSLMVSGGSSQPKAPDPNETRASASEGHPMCVLGAQEDSLGMHAIFVRAQVKNGLFNSL